MSDDSAGSLDNLVRVAFLNVRARLAILSTGAGLAWAELRVVASHTGLAIALVLVAAGMVLVVWILILLLFTLLLINTGFSAVLALVTTIFVNIIALLILCLYIRHTLKVISFEQTRKALGSVQLAPDD